MNGCGFHSNALYLMVVVALDVRKGQVTSGWFGAHARLFAAPSIDVIKVFFFSISLGELTIFL